MVPSRSHFLYSRIFPSQFPGYAFLPTTESSFGGEVRNAQKRWGEGRPRAPETSSATLFNLQDVPRGYALIESCVVVLCVHLCESQERTRRPGATSAHFAYRSRLQGLRAGKGGSWRVGVRRYKATTQCARGVGCRRARGTLVRCAGRQDVKLSQSCTDFGVDREYRRTSVSKERAMVTLIVMARCELLKRVPGYGGMRETS